MALDEHVTGTENIINAVAYKTVVIDRLYGLVVRVPANRSRGPGFDPWHYQIF
jgi:hypothetical protein